MGRRSRPHRDSIPDCPAQSVAIPTELPGPHNIKYSHQTNLVSSDNKTSRLLTVTKIQHFLSILHHDVKMFYCMRYANCPFPTNFPSINARYFYTTCHQQKLKFLPSVVVMFRSSHVYAAVTEVTWLINVHVYCSTHSITVITPILEACEVTICTSFRRHCLMFRQVLSTAWRTSEFHETEFKRCKMSLLTFQSPVVYVHNFEH